MQCDSHMCQDCLRTIFGWSGSTEFLTIVCPPPCLPLHTHTHTHTIVSRYTTEGKLWVRGNLSALLNVQSKDTAPFGGLLYGDGCDGQ